MHKTLSGILKSPPGSGQPFFLIAGPCVLEDEEMGFLIADRIIGITQSLNLPFIFKASYRKANRTKRNSFIGIGDAKALSFLSAIRKRFDIPVLTDIHAAPEAEMASEYVDVLQIPAFLCRQTELLQAAGSTGKVVNIKKGQFMSPEAMRFAAEKAHQSGSRHIMITERGTTFGYSDLVVDFRSVPIMQSFSAPKVTVVLDVTHSLQQPNQGTGVSGGLPRFIETIASAGIAAGAEGIFLETHPNPGQAKCDAGSMLPLERLEELLRKLIRIREAIRDQ